MFLLAITSVIQHVMEDAIIFIIALLLNERHTDIQHGPIADYDCYITDCTR